MQALPESEDSAELELPLVDAALRIGVSYIVAQRFMLTGRIAGRRVGGRWRVNAADVERVRAERLHAAPVYA